MWRRINNPAEHAYYVETPRRISVSCVLCFHLFPHVFANRQQNAFEDTLVYYTTVKKYMGLNLKASSVVVSDYAGKWFKGSLCFGMHGDTKVGDVESLNFSHVDIFSNQTPRQCLLCREKKIFVYLMFFRSSDFQ